MVMIDSTIFPQHQYLRSYFPNYLTTDSIFQKMVPLGAPWPVEVGKQMDDAYFTMFSGIKAPSEFVILHPSSTNESTADSLMIANVLWSIYGDSWTKLWNAFNLKYNPLNNYSLTEDTTRNQSDDRTINKAGTYNSEFNGTVNESTEGDSTTTVDHGLTVNTTGEIDNFTFAFNSQDEPVPTAQQKETSEQKNTGTDTTTVHSTGTDDTTSKSTTDDTSSENTTDKLDIDETINRTREGLVGQNTYQELLKQEFELWNWNFYKRVFRHVDEFLTLSIYTC